MKKEEAEKYLDNFPALTAKAKREAERTLQPFILYDNSGKARCTYCRHNVDIEIPPRKKVTEETPSGCMSYYPTIHKKRLKCPNCGKEALAINISNRFNGCSIESRSNVIVILNKRNDENLYLRCYTLKLFFKHGDIEPHIDWTEHRRYVFTPTTDAEFMPDDPYVPVSDWHIMSRVRELYFGNCWNEAKIVNTQALKKTWYCHSELIEYFKNEAGFYNKTLVKYIKFYRKHQGTERLIKCGFADLVKDAVKDKVLREQIDWKQTEPHKMLKLNKGEFNYIRFNAEDRHRSSKYERYIKAREIFPGLPIDKTLKYYDTTRYFGNRNIERLTKFKLPDIAKYLIKNNIHPADYYDYLYNCQKLKYDTQNNKQIVFPPNFNEAHDRVTCAIETLANKKEQEKLEKLLEPRKLLCMNIGRYAIIQPQSVHDIIREGKIQEHCVGGYAKRHCEGKLTIMFLRKKSDIDKPFYTIEVSSDLEIVQCRGYQNDRLKPKSKKVLDIEAKYAKYLEKIRPKWKKEMNKLKKAEQTVERIGA